MMYLSRSRAGFILVGSICLSLPFLVGQGCLGGSNNGGGGSGTVVVHAPSIDTTVSAGDTVTIVYDATNGPVSAFYDLDGIQDSGDETTFASNLSTGTNRFTQLQTASLAPNTYFVGITANGTTAYATGAVIISPAPQITFTSPVTQVKVGSGTDVPIRFSGGIANFTYLVFYDTNGSIDGDENPITSGSSSSAIVETTFSTAGVLPGTYHIGARVTAPGGTAVSAYAPGLIELVNGAFVQVLSPTIGLVTTTGSPIPISVAASDPSSSNATIRIFYDPDNTFDNGNDVTITTLPIAGTTANWDTTSIPPGSYYIGAELQNGFVPPFFSYSAGAVTLVAPGGGAGGGGGGGGGGTGGTPLLTVTTPLTPTIVFQGKTFRVNWLTNLQAGQGVVTVFREPDFNNDATPDGAGSRVTIGNPGIDAHNQFVDFDTTGVVGKYFIGATLTPSTGTPITAYAPATLTVQPLILWAGNLATKRDSTGKVIPQTGAFQGAIFRGFNFKDNLGSAMLTAEDYDGDGHPEIILVAQFAKPFLIQKDGRGAGEAYMIYSSTKRYSGNFDVNTTGSSQLPGVVFSGIIPNPFKGNDVDPLGIDRPLAGNSVPFTVDGQVAREFDTEGLRSVTLIPDQDGDGRQELVFGFPWCNSYSLAAQVFDGLHPAPLPGLGNLENNGHFLRGGLVVVSSWNPMLRDHAALSRHFDRVIELQEVGQVFNEMRQTWTGAADRGLPASISYCASGCANDPGTADSVNFPCEGFEQVTGGSGFITSVNTLNFTSAPIDPPRLSNPMPAGGLLVPDSLAHKDIVTPGFGYMGDTYCGELVDMSQVDPPSKVAFVQFIGGREGLGDVGSTGFCSPSSTDANGCATEPFGSFPPIGLIRVIGSGYYYLGIVTDTPDTACVEGRFATALEPYGCRILGQTTTQGSLGTTANRFGSSLSVSGSHLLVGAPLRTAKQSDVGTLPTLTRDTSGVVYMLPLHRPTGPADGYPWSFTPNLTIPNASGVDVSAQSPSLDLPYPHNYIIKDLGYTRCNLVAQGPGHPSFDVSHPLEIVGAAPGDKIGEVTGCHDINNDGLDDFAVGGPGTNQGRGAVYVIYRRSPEIEGNYLLEQLQLSPADANRLNGLMILGEPGEALGSSLAAGGVLDDDFNHDGKPDLLIGSPNANTAAGLNSGLVFILFGGKNLLNPAGGSTIAALRGSGDGMVIAGATAGDTAGMTVANAGDVNGDGIPDILIAAPNATPQFGAQPGLDLDGDGQPDDLDGDGFPDDLTQAGVVYVVFGGKHLTGTLSLSLIGSANLPGFTIAGRKAFDHLGGGNTQNNLPSRGVASAGDLDGDGKSEIMISSLLASPEGKTNAGEVYLLYGVRP